MQRTAVRSGKAGSLYCSGWTLNALLTKSSNLRKCSRPRTSGPSAQAMSLLRIEGMMRPSPTVRGSGSGRILVSAAGRGTRCSQRLSGSRVKFPRFRQQPELRRCGLAFIGVGDSAANTVAGLFPGCREAICLPPLRKMGYRRG